MERKQVHIIGGLSEESEHADQISETLARYAHAAAIDAIDTMDVSLHLTERSGGTEGLRTETDLRELVRDITGNRATKLVVWLPDTPRVKQIAREFRNSNTEKPRKDIYLAVNSRTEKANGQTQYNQALEYVKQSSANLALAHDTYTEKSMIVGPEEAAYDETDNLEQAVSSLIDIAELRSHLTFTQSTVIGGEPVDWNSSLVYPSLREVVDYCIRNDAYKPFLGVTAGHFAAKISENEFLTSRRKTDFRNLGKIGLVRVVTDGPDNVLAYGAKPSVGGQSQRIVFDEHQGENCIVHFHCPIMPGSNVPTVSQREYECGSHECGENTSRGLEVVDDGIKAVYLDNHGPNIVFNDRKDPRSIQEFVSDNFDLTKKTGGYQIASY